MVHRVVTDVITINRREYCLETADNGVSRVLALSRARGHTGRLLIRPEAAIRHTLTLKITSKLILFHKRISVCLQFYPCFSSYTSSIAGNYGCQHWVYNIVAYNHTKHGKYFLEMTPFLAFLAISSTFQFWLFRWNISVNFSFLYKSTLKILETYKPPKTAFFNARFDRNGVKNVISRWNKLFWVI